MLTVGSLFSGIGGLDLGLERAGMSPAWQIEIDPYCRSVLAKHWPDVQRYEDVRRHGADLESVDLICGGFPCQPVSSAGSKRAQADPRWLWPEFARIVRLLRPRYVLVENVAGLLPRGAGLVLGELAASGYDAEWDCIPAAAVGAPHRRDRILIVAYARGERRRWSDERSGQRQEVAGRQQFGGDGEARNMADPDREGELQPTRGILKSGRRPGDCGWWAIEPDVGRVAHGIPSRVDRLRALGNAVVPQVAEWVGRQIVTHSKAD